MIKNICLTIFTFTILCAGCHSGKEEASQENEQEEPQITLYDANKEAIAYIDYDDDSTIYTLKGEPVAYLELEEQVYGFNGKFLGWYFDGVLYDRTCHAVGAKHGIVRGGINTAVTSPEKIKGIKHIKPVKHVRETGSIRPVLFDSWSETPLTEFLDIGKKE